MPSSADGHQQYDRCGEQRRARRRRRPSAPPGGAAHEQASTAVANGIAMGTDEHPAHAAFSPLGSGRRRLLGRDRLGDAHGIGVDGAELVVGAVGEHEREREKAEADDDRGEDQRLRQGVGDGPAGAARPSGTSGGSPRVSRPDGEDHQVGGVPDQHQAEEVTDQAAAQHQVHRRREQPSHEDREDVSMSGVLLEGEHQRGHGADDDEIDADVEDSSGRAERNAAPETPRPVRNGASANAATGRRAMATAIPTIASARGSTRSVRRASAAAVGDGVEQRGRIAPPGRRRSRRPAGCGRAAAGRPRTAPSGAITARAGVDRMSEFMSCPPRFGRSLISAKAPSAATATTMISPRVSSARKSTRITLTMLRP